MYAHTFMTADKQTNERMNQDKKTHRLTLINTQTRTPKTTHLYVMLTMMMTMMMYTHIRNTRQLMKCKLIERHSNEKEEKKWKNANNIFIMS